MATKAELLAELEMLRAKMAENEASDETDAEPPDDTEPETEQDDADTADATTRDQAASQLERVLAPYGVSAAEIETLAEQLWSELESLPQKKPLVMTISAFALGFILGRMTK